MNACLVLHLVCRQRPVHNVVSCLQAKMSLQCCTFTILNLSSACLHRIESCLSTKVFSQCRAFIVLNYGSSQWAWLHWVIRCVVSASLFYLLGAESCLRTRFSTQCCITSCLQVKALHSVVALPSLCCTSTVLYLHNVVPSNYTSKMLYHLVIIPPECCTFLKLYLQNVVPSCNYTSKMLYLHKFVSSV